jgi:hypothetical protein
MDHPRPWLRLIDADDLDDSIVDFEKLKVRSSTGDTLGHVDGFVVDRDSGRPYYVVVDAGGWFKSKHFLLPIGHAQLDEDRDAILTDLGRERVDRFPGFDKDEFDRWSDDEMRRVAEETSTACGFVDTTIAVWERSTYRQPTWWRSSFYPQGRAAARTSEAASNPHSAAASGRAASAEREAVVAKGGESSPHPGGRAQPGDVVGIETGGERTHIGDTKATENERRRDAERDAAKQRRD